MTHPFRVPPSGVTNRAETHQREFGKASDHGGLGLRASDKIEEPSGCSPDSAWTCVGECLEQAIQRDSDCGQHVWTLPTPANRGSVRLDSRTFRSPLKQ